MGLLDFLGPSDPARSWIPAPGLSLEVDLDSAVFSGLRLGEPAAAISRFGPPENPRPTRDGMFDYPSRGFEIDTTDDRIDCFLFRWNAQDPGKRFRGVFRFGGRGIRLDETVGQEAVESIFGQPWWTDDELGERILFYEFGHGQREWQLEFERGHLTVLTILTPPLLADPEQRNAYRVTRPWPPSS